MDLSRRELRILRRANNALYFQDAEAMKSALWFILENLAPERFANDADPVLTIMPTEDDFGPEDDFDDEEAFGIFEDMGISEAELDMILEGAEDL